MYCALERYLPISLPQPILSNTNCSSKRPKWVIVLPAIQRTKERSCMEGLLLNTSIVPVRFDSLLIGLNPKVADTIKHLLPSASTLFECAAVLGTLTQFSSYHEFRQRVWSRGTRVRSRGTPPPIPRLIRKHSAATVTQVRPSAPLAPCDSCRRAFHWLN